MYAKVKNNELVKFPYLFEELQADNPYTNYGNNIDFVAIFPHTDEAVKHGYELVVVQDDPVPDYNGSTHRVELSAPTFTNGKWVRVWSVVAKTEQEMVNETEDRATTVRQQRNKLLSESDWTQVADAPVDKNVWSTYRQLLREIPKQPGFPFSVLWPIKP